VDIIALIATAALIVGPLLAYQHNKRARAAKAAAAAEAPLAPLAARYSRSSILGMIAGNLVISLGSLFAIYDRHFLSSIAAPMLAGCTFVGLLWCHRLMFRTGEDVIIVDAAGFRDKRICPCVIPWIAISDVRESIGFKTSRLPEIILTIDEAQAVGLQLPQRRWLARKLCGKDVARRFHIMLDGLDIAPGLVLNAIRAHLAAR
jgi:hypothetical protein